MDISRLQNILNALKFSKKIEPSSKVSKQERKEGVTPSSSSAEDSVTISDEAFLKINIEKVSNEIEKENNTVREEKINEIKERLSNKNLEGSSEEIAKRILQGPDIYEQLR